MGYVLDLNSRSEMFDAESATRIFGGRQAQPGAWPAQVALHSAQDVSNTAESRVLSQFCGGSLISRQWVLTAAHCVVLQDGNVVPPEAVLIQTGNVDLTRGDFRRVSRIVVHEQYDPTRIDNDIALIRLSEPITQSSGPVAAIPVIQQGAALPDGPAVVVGWGMLEEGKRTHTLMETDIDIVPNATCNQGMAEQLKRDLGAMLLDFGVVGQIPQQNLEQAYTILTSKMGDRLSGNMICAGTPSGQRDSCKGDSGGPLMIRRQDGRWMQVGVVSWGASPLGAPIPCGHPELYAVYTRISNYFDWIGRHVRGQ
jgi:secreted trypsin-like serine protease